MKYQRISSKGMLVWIIRLTLAAIAGSFLIHLTFPGRGLAYKIVMGIWLSLYFVIFAFYYPIRYYRLSYSVNERIIVVNCGVIYRRRKAIFLRNVQYTTTGCTPLQAIFGLRSLLIHAPGGFLLLPHLEREECNRLREWVEMEEG